MLTISERSTPVCLVVEVQGAVTGDEYDDFLESIDDAIEARGRINLVINLIGSVKFGDFDAVEEDFEFTFKEYRKVRRAAFVGDQKVIRAMLKLFSPFTRTHERLFDAGDLDAAIEWASAAD